VSSRLRILVVAACPLPIARGTPVRILRLAETLVARGHDVEVATYHLGEGPVAPGLKLRRIDDIPSYTRMAPGPSYRKLVVVDPKLRRLVRQLLAAGRFDVIHAHHFEGLLVSAGLKKAAPIVYDAHTMLASELAYYPLGLPSGLKRFAGRVLDRWIPKLAHHTVTVTETIRDKLIAECGMSPERVTVVPNGVEVDHFDPAAQPPRAPRDHRAVIFTGNLAEYQGIDHLLRAFARAAKQVPDVRLRIASDSAFAPYEALARQLGIRDRIDLIVSPTFAQLPRLLSDADIAVNPRVECDGVPVKLLNYMAAARPVVSFDRSAPGVVHGETAWLAPGGDDDALGDGMLALLNDPGLATRIGQAARQHVLERSSWDRSAGICEDVYARLLSARR
jgi:glycosyltransferase involved in cell wall biosynthesis